MKIVLSNPSLLHRTLDEHQVPVDVLKAAEQFDPEDPLGYSGDFPKNYELGGWLPRSGRRWDKSNNYR